MDEIDIHAKLAQIETAPHFSEIFDGDTERAEMIAEHLIWLHTIRRERPLVSKPYKVGIYIRYFNQTRYENYLDFHKKGFVDTLALCPKWELVDFYIDEGSTAQFLIVFFRSAVLLDTDFAVITKAFQYGDNPKKVCGLGLFLCYHFLFSFFSP